MSIVLITACLLATSYSYAVIHESDYIYTTDNSELITAKESLMVSKNRLGSVRLIVFQKTLRNKKTLTTQSEVVYKVGDKNSSYFLKDSVTR